VERPPYRCGSAAGARELSGIVVHTAHTHDRNPSFSRIDRSFSFRTARVSLSYRLDIVRVPLEKLEHDDDDDTFRNYRLSIVPSPFPLTRTRQPFFCWCVRVLLPIVSQIVSSSLVSFRFVRLGHGEVRSHDRWCVCVVL